MSNKEVHIPFCKTVYATKEDFADFQAFVNRVEADPEVQKAGVVKVVPPSDWRATSQDYEELIKGLYVKNPIEQNFCCKKPGVYELYLIQRKSMKVTDYRKRVEHSDSLTENKDPEKVEKMYWKSLAFNPPLYGADVRGSMFEEDCNEWNLNKLRGILESGLGGTEVSGINVPYFYFGAWRTTFAWHCEDFNLPSINYLHYGKPKFWYTVRAEDGPKLEEIAKRNFPEKFHQCPEFMRHKNTVIDPYLVKSVDPSINIHKVMQQKGEFVITLPGAYHSGFNWGFNIAEAVNFATNNWLSIFPRCTRCKCSSDNVRLSPKVFYSNLVQNDGLPKNSPLLKQFKRDIESLETDTQDESDEDDTQNKNKNGGGRMGRMNTGRMNHVAKPSGRMAVALAKPSATKGSVASSSPKDKKKSTVKKIKEKKASKVTTPKKSLTKDSPKGEKDIHNWIQCSKCYKWRRLPKERQPDEYKNKKFSCSELKRISCHTEEERWRRQYTTLAVKHN